MRNLIVLPTYNEAETVLQVSKAALSQDPSLEVLVVDDNSPDGTAELVESCMREEPRLHLLRREAKLGLGSAYLAGFRYGLGQAYGWIFTMDCDLSHDPSDLPRLMAAMADYDLVIGSRYVPGGRISSWPLQRRLLSRFANFYTRVLLRLPVRDCTSGYRCYSREVLEGVEPFSIRSTGYSFLEEMVLRVHRAGFRIGEIPILFEDRRSGSSKIDRAEIYRAAWHVLISALRPPAFQTRSAAPGPAEKQEADSSPES